ncbi:MAG: squalene/phytoene synthase family protein [Nitratireductor sp.]|nr:squalene/phytoene synthase family protein [Nitratireductor sp.]
MSGTGLDAAFAHCARLLRDENRPRYAARLFVAEPARNAVLALDAFRLETRRIPFLVSEPIPGEIRLQWWREVLRGERAGEAEAHPVAQALLEVVTGHHLPVPAFERYLDALAFDLYHDAMPDAAAFEGWIGETESFLLQIQAIVCGAQTGTGLADACGHGGMALGIARLLRLLSWYRRREQHPFPPQYLDGMDRETWLSAAGAAHHGLVQSIAARGLDHAARARSAIRRLDKPHRAVFLPLCEAEALLQKASRDGAAAFGQMLEIAPLALQWRYWKTALAGF